MFWKQATIKHVKTRLFMGKCEWIIVCTKRGKTGRLKCLSLWNSGRPIQSVQSWDVFFAFRSDQVKLKSFGIKRPVAVHAGMLLASTDLNGLNNLYLTQ